MNKKGQPISLVTGSSGQDGSILSRLLVNKGHQVFGMTRRSSVDNTQRLQLLNLYSPLNNVEENFHLLVGDMTDLSSLSNVFHYILDECGRIDYIYNCAAQSHVKVSFQQPLFTFDVNTKGVLNLLELCKNMKTIGRPTKLLHCSTSEMFGNSYSYKREDNNKEIKYQNEDTSFIPNSPYAISKLAAHHLIKSYREAHNIFCSTSICFNHEAPLLRGEHFVTRKIAIYLANLYNKSMRDGEIITPFVNKLSLGNLNACRDWGNAIDYCKGMISILESDEPDDYILATGETHSVLEFLQEAFTVIGLPSDKEYIMKFVNIDPSLYRPCEVDYLCGDAKKIKEKLGWCAKNKFKDLVKDMIESEIEYQQGRQTNIGLQ